MRFEDLGLAPEILRAVNELGYSETTPIQAEVIPKILSGDDLLAAAQTGTGKTAAFMLPILDKLKKFSSASTSPAMHPVRALVITPTRELADQVSSNVKYYAQYLTLRHTVVFGGVNMDAQVDILRKGVEILVATPGRLLDHIGQKNINLSKVDILVLDEADRMLDMGFINDIRKLMDLLPKTRQTLLFSATFSKEIKKLAEDFMRSPKLVEVAKSNAAAEHIEQHIYAVDNQRKRHLLEHLIKQHEMSQVIVFCKTKQSVDRLTRELKQNNFAAEAIHGDKTQAARLEIISLFKSNNLRILVATDVAARGLDISDLPYVVNYELPNTPEDYVHRIGRTGRAGSSGVAISFMSEEEQKQLDAIALLTRQELKAEPVDGFWPLWIKAPAKKEVDLLAHVDCWDSLEQVAFKPPFVFARHKTNRKQQEIPVLLLPPRYR